MTAALKEVTSHHKFLSGARCVNQVLKQAVTEDEVIDTQSNHCNLVRLSNCQRKRSCPKYPQSLDFEVVTEYIPENFLGDKLSVQGKWNYKAVLRSVLQLLPGEPSVQRLLMDFQMAIWKAAESFLRLKERDVSPIG